MVIVPLSQYDAVNERCLTKGAAGVARNRGNSDAAPRDRLWARPERCRSKRSLRHGGLAPNDRNLWLGRRRDRPRDERAPGDGPVAGRARHITAPSVGKSGG